jgi:dihydroorotate dehydrogenase electron transfer subunit
MVQGNFKILSNEKVGPDYFKMAISAPVIARQARPGQFVHLRCHNGIEPLLRRPFSFHRLNRNNFELLYKIVGRGTNLLAKQQKGGKIDVLGPLGNGFDTIRGTRDEGRGTILVAGGMGVAPLLALAERLYEGRGKREEGRRERKLLVLLGAKNKRQILCEREFKKSAAEVQIATDDGSRGYKGLVTDLLKKVLRPLAISYLPFAIYACGPKPMLKETAAISKAFAVSAQGCLEENMACGVGACQGCAIRTKAGYKRVCKDGPVFDLKDIQWT